MADVQQFAGQKSNWDGPTTGSVAAEGKKIVVLADDMKNGDIQGVTNGVTEAAGVIGRDVTVPDGEGSVQTRAPAFGQALALNPSGTVIDGFDAVEQQAALDQAKASGIPLVSWFAGPVIGPDAANGIFGGISTDAMEVSAAAAKWAFAGRLLDCRGRHTQDGGGGRRFGKRRSAPSARAV